MTELRACPFCRNLCVNAALVDAELQAYAVGCGGCDTIGPWAPSKDAAIAAWNRRADDWEPIETAPRDKMLMLGHVEDAAPTMGYYARGAWREHNGKGTPLKPTHWRPLPEGPR